MASQGRQAISKISNMIPKGGGKGIFTGTGALLALGALGFGINASLFNGTRDIHITTTYLLTCCLSIYISINQSLFH